MAGVLRWPNGSSLRQRRCFIRRNWGTELGVLAYRAENQGTDGTNATYAVMLSGACWPDGGWLPDILTAADLIAANCSQNWLYRSSGSQWSVGARSPADC